jgi:hypothetical protein
MIRNLSPITTSSTEITDDIVFGLSFISMDPASGR